MWMESEGRSPQARCTRVPGAGQDAIFPHMTPIIRGHKVSGEGGIRGGSYLVLPTHGEGCWRSCDTPWATICYCQQILKSPGFMEFPDHPVVKTPSFHCWRSGGGGGFQSLDRGLRSRTPCGTTKKKTNTWVQVKGISSLTLLSGHLDFYGPSAAIACVGFMPPIFTIHSAIVPIERVRMVLITALISWEEKVNYPRMSVTDFTISFIVTVNTAYVAFIDSFLFPRTSVRVDTTFIRASIGPPCEWRWKSQHFKAWSVEIAWSSLSIHPPSASALSISALQDGTLRALVSVAVCVWGVTLTVNAFVLEQGLHCVSLGENKNPWDTELTSRKGSRAKSANRLQS